MNVASEKCIAVSWQLRAETLSPLGVAARGTAARVLARRILLRDDENLSRLEGISARAGDDDWLLFRGGATDLPWADGAIYLGRDADAPALLLPTLWRPAPDAALLQRALKIRFNSEAPLALVPPCAHREETQNIENAPHGNAVRVLTRGETLVFSLESARRIARAPLEAWLRTQGEEPPICPDAPKTNVQNDNAREYSPGAKSPIGDIRLSDEMCEDCVANLASPIEEANRAPEENR